MNSVSAVSSVATEATVGVRSREPGPLWVRWAAAGLAIAMASLTLFRHWHYLSGTFDLGFYTQDVWNIGHGIWRNTVGGFHVFADHLSPVLILLAPFAYLPTTEALLLIQAAAVALGLFPVYRLGARHGGPRLGRLTAVWYALSVGIWHAVTFDFHPLTLGVPLLMWLIAEVDSAETSTRPLLIAIGMTLIREDMAILAAMILIQGAYQHRNRRFAIWSLVPAAVGVGYVTWVSLWSGGMGGYHLWSRFGDSGDPSITDVVASLAANLARPDPLVSIAAVLLPVLILPAIIGWRYSWPGLGIMIFNGMTSYGEQASLYYQYFAAAVPFLIWGAAVTWSRRKSGGKATGPSPIRSDGPAYMATVVIFLILGPLFYIGYGLEDRYATTIATASDRRVLAGIVARVDPSAAVSATDHLLPHLATRAAVYPFPGPMLCSPSPIFNVDHTFYPPLVAIEWADAVEGADWEAVLRSWGYTPTHSNNLASIWRLEGDPPPTVQCPSLEETWGNVVSQPQSGDNG